MEIPNRANYEVRRDLHVVIGSLAGFILGGVGRLAFFYLVFMLPKGATIGTIDQGAIPTVIFGPLGAIIGGVIGRFVFRARKPAVPKPAPDGRSGHNGHELRH